jgi:hypothetical protein
MLNFITGFFCIYWDGHVMWFLYLLLLICCITFIN